MPPSTAQRQVVAQFVSITGAQEKIASSYCKKYNWKLDQACDAYFAQNPNAAGSFKVEENLTKLFEKYRDSRNDEKDTIGVDGTMAYLTDLGVDLENASVLIPVEIIQAPTLGEITKQEFIDGWKKASGAGAPLDTVAAQKTFIAQQSSAMSHDVDLFKRVYKHTFICSKEKGQKALPLENAKIYWTMLFSQPGIKWETANRNWLAIWLEFLDAKWTKSVNKDMWNQTFEFFQKSMQDESLSFWSEDGAWPSVIDDFVAYVKEKYPPQGQDGDKMETD